MNTQDLIALLQSGAANITININQPVMPAASVADDDMDDDDYELPATDFEEGDMVLLCNVKDGHAEHLQGEVIAIQQEDDKGFYTRVQVVDGDLTRYFRAGLTLNAERLGTQIVMKL